MGTIGRNQPCPCGSGFKFKKCCGLSDKGPKMIQPGSPIDIAIQQAYQRKMAEIAQKQKQQGLGRGIISGELGGRRIVCVGDRVWASPRWKTFHDFLDEYLLQKLGLKWFSVEMAKSADQRHRIVRWRQDAVADMKRTGVSVGGVSTGVMTGAQQAYLNLAYNVYLVAHHAPVGQSEQLLETFLRRLRSERSDDFTGKLFETYAAAAFLKAGFLLDYEDESVGGPSHVEFTATYPETDRKFSVEVKSRNRAAGDVTEVEEFQRLRVNSKLLKALQKDADHTRVVMIEINVPDVLTEASLDGWPGAALDQIRQAEKIDVAGRPELPPAYVLVTNHAFHNNLTIATVAAQMLAVGYKIPDFGPDVDVSSLAAFLASKERHREIFALIESMRTHYEVPSTFDGENPAYSFAEPSDVPRLRFGNWYEIPLSDSRTVGGRLYDAIVMENEMRVVGAYETTEGKHVLAACPMSDAEFAAWKRHPETYFGEVRQINRPVKNWLEMALFFHETYKHTPREKLAEWFKTFPDAEAFRGLSQSELAIAYSERMARSASQMTEQSGV